MKTPDERPHRALILCGGGARGAIEVGFYQALVELGLSFDLIVGSSVGALNGALIAAGMPPADLAAVWRRIRQRDIMAWNWRGLLAGNGGFYTLDPLRRLLRRTLPVHRFEELRIPLVVTTTSLQTGGVASNVPFEPALMRGAREALLILCTCCPPARHPLRSPFKILLRGFAISLDSKYAWDLDHYQRQGLAIRAVRPEFPQAVGLLNFEHTDALIRAGYEQGLAALCRPGR